MKKGYSKNVLLDYLDGELSLNDSEKVADNLFQDENALLFLEDIANVDSLYKQTIDIKPSKEIREKIFQEAFTLLDKRKESQKNRRKMISISINKLNLKNLIPDISMEFQYGLVVLVILISTTFYLGKGKVIYHRKYHTQGETLVYTNDEFENFNNVKGEDI